MKYKFIKYINLFLTGLLLLTLGFFLGKKYNFAIDQNNNLITINQSVNEQKLKTLFNLIGSQYIKKIDGDSLVDETISQVLRNLDPHSTYSNSSFSAIRNKEITGSYEGLGIELKEVNDTLTIVKVLKESNNRNLLFPGDKLIKINNKSLTKVEFNQFSSIIQKNKIIHLEILRKGQKNIVKAKKNKILYPSVESRYKINTNTGYIKLTHFSENSSQEFHKSLNFLKALGINDLIIDLRDNGGGILNEAVKIADELLPKNNIIVYLQNEKDKKKEYFYATEGGLFEKGKVKVLINENSASASEVLAAALQDNDRAILVGRRTFGKGLVQREIGLDDGSKIRITTAHYFSPLGRNIQKPIVDNQEYDQEIVNRYYTGELYDETKIVKDDKYKKITKKGRVLYGGGGIIPDIFVPIQEYNIGEIFSNSDDLERLDNYLINEVARNIQYYYNFSEDRYLNNFNTNHILNNYISINKSKFVLNDEQRNIMLQYIKAYIGNVVFGNSMYHQIWNKTDTLIKKSLE